MKTGSLSFAFATLVLAPFADLAPAIASERLPTLRPTVMLWNPEARDQDDMCFWLDEDEPERSTVIVSDKFANRIFVYDLDGAVLQTIHAEMPGNIDIRHAVRIGGRTLDVVAVPEREKFRILVFGVDRETRMLVRLDDGSIHTSESVGGGLYRSPRDGRLHFFKTTGGNRLIEQFELHDAGSGGGITGKRMRTWVSGETEGAVAHDEAGVVFIGDEERGVWKVGAEPEDPPPGELVIRVDEHGLRADVEGLAIYRVGRRRGYLLVSSQGSSAFHVYDLEPPHAFRGAFRIRGAIHTDGIEVVGANLGTDLPHGLFASHTHQVRTQGRPVLLTPFASIADELELVLPSAPSGSPPMTVVAGPDQ